MPDSSKLYRGRFAPSPTGPLHLGSLIAAVASYLDARSNQGAWLVRMDDLDPPREMAGAADSILHALVQHGLHWDEQVLWQSARSAAYDRALAQLDLAGHTFRCQCTRATLAPDGACRGACLDQPPPADTPCSTRIVVAADCRIAYLDQVQGLQQCSLGRDEANFLVHRRDGLYAYQLAVVVDDAHQGITHIMRGSDLLTTTPRQVYLQQTLGHPSPAYCHIPVITNQLGQKFSKQHHATPLNNDVAAENLRKVLKFLCQAGPPPELATTDQILAFAADQWSVERIPGVLAIAADQHNSTL